MTNSRFFTGAFTAQSVVIWAGSEVSGNLVSWGRERMCRGRNVEEKDYMEKVTWKTDTIGASNVEERDCMGK